MPRLNIQADVRQRLADALSVEVRTHVPDPRPETFVLVRRSGGRRLNFQLDRAGLDVLAWAPTEAEAYDLVDAASDVIADLRFADGYAEVAEEAMRSEPDPATDSPRWFASWTITTYRISD